jgi:hypothetical protein
VDLDTGRVVAAQTDAAAPVGSIRRQARRGYRFRTRQVPKTVGYVVKVAVPAGERAGCRR